MIHTRTYDAPEINDKEIMRYAGVRGEVPELEALLQNCLKEIAGKLIYKVCYSEFPIICQGDRLDLGFTETDSQALKKNLTGCDRLILFAATVGIEMDRLIARYNTISPAKALMFQAIGAERIESLCDTFNREITGQKAEEGLSTRPRFSPGYGDFPLEVQREIFSALDCSRKIGVSLNSSLLMSPSKSVTAIIGISGQKEDGEASKGCRSCLKQDCIYRNKNV